MRFAKIGSRRLPHIPATVSPAHPACRGKMRMSGLCKVEMSVLCGAGRYGTGANRLEHERAGTIKGFARSRARPSETARRGAAVAVDPTGRCDVCRCDRGKKAIAGIVHRLRGRPSNRKIPEGFKLRALRELHQARYAGFGPTLAGKHWW
jgi:hypothetical protein